MAPPPIVALKPRTAHDLVRKLTDGGRVGGRSKNRPAPRGVTWVKVTGAPDGDGWHPGFVSIDMAGVFEDLTTEVLVASADGSALADGSRHLCTQTGSDGDGVARFRTIAPTFTSWKHVVRCASTGNVDVTAPGSSIDGVTLSTGDAPANRRVLLKNQSNGIENGPYQWNGAAVAMSRTADADGVDDLVEARVPVAEGTVNADTVWRCTANKTWTPGSDFSTWERVYPQGNATGELYSSNILTVAATTYSFQNTGITFTLPAAGTYVFTVRVATEIGASALSSPDGGTTYYPAGLKLRLYNQTDSAVVGPIVAVTTSSIVGRVIGHATLTGRVVATGATVIRVEAEPFVAATYTHLYVGGSGSVVGVGTFGGDYKSVMTYIRTDRTVAN